MKIRLPKFLRTRTGADYVSEKVQQIEDDLKHMQESRDYHLEMAQHYRDGLARLIANGGKPAAPIEVTNERKAVNA